MKTLIKIPRLLFEQAKTDLLRPHPFAYERVGFFSTRRTVLGSITQTHCVAYDAVDDEDYLKDESVGARIGPVAITKSMSRSVNNSVGQLHVHWHGGSGLPNPSFTDNNELPSLARSLMNANNAEIHGWIILGERDAFASLISPDNAEADTLPDVSIVGFPTLINRRHPTGQASVFANVLGRLKKVKGRNQRYARQSFLGSNADIAIRQALIGIIGLGGGGSHIVQQLALLGFRNFVLCDHDIITESNLNRLVGGSSADVRAKRTKTCIAERSIRKLHRDAVIINPPSKWEDMMGSLINADIVIGCVDTYAARRDLEAFCRRQIIPFLDVGMDVHQSGSGVYEINGQVILSMPGYACMHCMGFLNETVLAEEAAKYGAAGDRPQVVWSNGLLCSAAVGVAVDLLTDWSGTMRHAVYLAFKGSELSLTADNRLPTLRGIVCRHYPLAKAGAPVLRKL